MYIKHYYALVVAMCMNLVAMESAGKKPEGSFRWPDAFFSFCVGVGGKRSGYPLNDACDAAMASTVIIIKKWRLDSTYAWHQHN